MNLILVRLVRALPQDKQYMLVEHQCVRSKTPLKGVPPASRPHVTIVPVGSIGTVVSVFATTPALCDVEFFDENCQTIALAIASDDDVELVDDDEVRLVIVNSLDEPLT